MNKTNIKKNLEEIELNKETHSFMVDDNQKQIKVCQNLKENLKTKAEF